MTQQLLPTWLTTSFQPSSAMPDWIKAYQTAHWQAICQRGLPLKQDERFKYVDFSFLNDTAFKNAAGFLDLTAATADLQQRENQRYRMVFVDGRFIASLSTLPDGIIACSLADAICNHPSLLRDCWPQTVDEKTYPFAALTAALFTDGSFIWIPDQFSLTTPIQLIHYGQSDAQFTVNQHIIKVGKHAKVSFLTEYKALTEAAYLTSAATYLLADANAAVNWYKIQNENTHAIHLAHTFVSLHENSDVSAVTLATGSAFTRDDFVADLKAANAVCKTSGYYHMTHNKQVFDHHVDMNHLAQNTQSDMLYKGVLNKKSSAVFNGRLYVAKQAQKISAYQANHNLLLSKEAEVYSKPELEIYADDVKCKHGATTGQIDLEALFYLRARGIAKDQALEILLRGFAQDILDRIQDADIKQRMLTMVAAS